ncbi:MAG: lysophospholipid acyltransferase family protein [Coriobacteriia bacterium]|nr:lysophospholipid acyltransferase family protein [Coriobacteriia bacterium]
MSRPDPLRAADGFRGARFLRATLARFLLAIFRVRTLGADNVPEGPVLLAGNHVSYGDPILLWCAAPRRVHFMAKVELWQSAFLGWALDRVWAFPVRRGTADREALSIAGALLAAGETVGVFPEGTRNREGTAEAQQGAAFIAMRAGVPIVPVGIAGTDRIKPKGARLMRFPRVTISYGKPVTAEEFGDMGRKQRVEAMTAEVMVRITTELTRARGVGGS